MSKPMLIFCFIVLSYLVFTNADTCLTAPSSLGSGASCSGAISCAYPLYCNNQSICTPYLAVGSPCIINFDTCAVGSDCRGPPGSSICVAYAGPGQSCSSADPKTTTVPACGAWLGQGFNPCDSQSNTCKYGFVNDTCSKNADCLTNICLNNLCVAYPAGASCSSSFQCAPGYFCQPSTNANSTCVPRLTTGVCTSDSDCAYGYVCEKQSATDQRQCIAVQSKKPGDYCGNNAFLCQGSNRCVGGYCAQNSGDTCYLSDSSACAINQVCACHGKPFGINFGIGNCIAAGCQGVTQDFVKCMNQNCNAASIPNFPFLSSSSVLSTYSTGSCAQKFCSSQLTGALNCFNAGVSLSASFFFVTFFALLTTYFAKL